MSEELKPCSAHVPGPNLCRNGFPQNASCSGATCHGCGRPSDKVPACMNEDIHKAWIDDSGRPRFAPKRKA